MVIKLYRLLIIVIPLMSLPVSVPYADTIKLINTISDDNDGVRQRKHVLGYIKSVTSAVSKIDIGLYGGQWLIDDSIGNNWFSIIGVSGDADFGDMGKILSEVMIYDSNAWTTETFNLSYRQASFQPWYFEANLERSIVDSITSINNQIMVDTYSLSIDVPITDQFTLVGAGIYQNFTDENTKQGGLIKVIYTSENFEGLNTALVIKQLNSDTRGTGYFSPEKQQQLYVETTYATPIINEKFVVKASAGLGKEYINDDIQNDLLKLEISGRGWFDDFNGIEGRLGCNNSGDVLTNRPTSNYRYCYAGLNYLRSL